MYVLVVLMILLTISNIIDDSTEKSFKDWLFCAYLYREEFQKLIIFC